MTTLTDLRPLADQFQQDVLDLAPGCDLLMAAQTKSLLMAVLTHKVTRRIATVSLDADCGWAVSTKGSRTTGITAYGFDSALVHVYRHDLDFTSEHGPGTAWDYSQKGA